MRFHCTGIIINIDTISNINLKAGMCHMEVDWFITIEFDGNALKICISSTQHNGFLPT